MRTISSLNSSVQMRPRDLERQPGLGVDDADGVELVGLVVAGRVVAAALLGEDVHEHRAAEARGLAQRGLDGLLVVAVDRAEVLQAEVLEHALRARRCP